MSMTKTQVIELLNENRNERGMANWEKMTPDRISLRSYGIGLTQLRKMAKQIGRDPELAKQLWDTDIYDAKVIGLLIDDPKHMTREQVEEQVENLQGGMLLHVFSTCGATLARTPFAFDLANDWMASEDPVRRDCGYSLLYELSKKNPKGMDDEYLLSRIAHIRKEIDNEKTSVRTAMGAALMGIGKRNRELNQAAVSAAEAIGPIDFGTDNSCEPLDVHKHLTSDYLKKKLGL